MRDFWLIALLLTLAVFAGVLVYAAAIDQPQAHEPLRNAYHPFSVEVQVRDR